MANATSVTSPMNQSQPGNIITPEYSDVELVFLGVAMAILVVAIVFGKYEKIQNMHTPKTFKYCIRHKNHCNN